MPFIGNQPALSYTSFAKQDFTTSATTSYTLDQPVANANELALFINFVRQEPTTSYTASGTTLTLTSATSASDDMYCVFLGKAVQTVNPPSGSVGTSQLSSTLDFSSKTITLASNMKNTPAFRVTNSSSQSIPNNAWTKVSFDTEDYDTNNAFASSTFTVPSGEAGKYIFNWIVQSTLDSGEVLVSALYINGSRSDKTQCRQMSVGALETLVATGSVSTTLSVSDTVELYMYQNQGAAQNNSSGYTYFSGYKLIGV